MHASSPCGTSQLRGKPVWGSPAKALKDASVSAAQTMLFKKRILNRGADERCTCATAQNGLPRTKQQRSSLLAKREKQLQLGYISLITYNHAPWHLAGGGRAPRLWKI
jgi:hypothetical protein